MMHIIRVSYQQSFFSTLTVCHVSIAAKSVASAVSHVKQYYHRYRVKVEFIATLPAQRASLSPMPK